MRQANIDEGNQDGLTSAEQAEIVQLRRDTRQLEMENRIPRRAGRLTCRVLGFSGQLLCRGSRRTVSRIPCT